MNSNHSLHYEIRVRGKIPAAWMDAFADLTCTEQTDACGQVTRLVGEFADPAALQGILNNLTMLGMNLISVECRNDCQACSR
jgi:hypothetical protein